MLIFYIAFIQRFALFALFNFVFTLDLILTDYLVASAHHYLLQTFGRFHNRCCIIVVNICFSSLYISNCFRVSCLLRKRGSHVAITPQILSSSHCYVILITKE